VSTASQRKARHRAPGCATDGVVAARGVGVGGGTGTPTGTHRQAGAGRALPHPSRPSLRSRAPRHDVEAALQDHGPTHGVGATRFAHRGVPCDDDRQIAVDQRVSTMIRRARATTTGKRCSPARPWTTSGTASERTFPCQGHHRAATTRAGCEPVWGTRTAGARMPARHARLGPSRHRARDFGPACRTGSAVLRRPPGAAVRPVVAGLPAGGCRPAPQRQGGHGAVPGVSGVGAA
jgi:hypothetical protein